MIKSFNKVNIMNEVIVVSLYTLAFLFCGELLRRYFNNLADNSNVIKKVVSYREYSYFSKKKKEKLIQKENILIEKERFLNIRKLLVQYRELIIDTKTYDGNDSSLLIKLERVFRYHFNIVFNVFFVDNKINKDKNSVFILTDVEYFNGFIKELTSIPNKPTPELNVKLKEIKDEFYYLLEKSFVVVNKKSKVKL